MKRTVIIGNVSDEILALFQNDNFDVFILNDNYKVNKSICNHMDLSVLQIDEQTFVLENQQFEFIDYLTKNRYNTIIVDMFENAIYPDDCILNFLISGNTVFGSKKCLTDQIKFIFANNGLKFINVNQGYTKCSSLKLGNDKIITDDKSIYSAALNQNLEALLINKGDIRLDGFDYGFIGGASAVDYKNKIVYFFGDITKHRDFSEIMQFLVKHDYTYKFIQDYPLTDIGGAVII